MVFVLPPVEESPAIEEVIEGPPAVVTVEEGSEPPIDFDWVTIPAGEFLMGSDKQKDSMAWDRETATAQAHVA